MPQEFIKEHSGIVVVILGALFSLIAAITAWFIKHVRTKIINHIDKAENEIVPAIDGKIDELEKEIMHFHIQNLERFSNLDKRLTLIEDKSIMDVKKLTDIHDKLAIIVDKLTKKVDRITEDG